MSRKRSETWALIRDFPWNDVLSHSLFSEAIDSLVLPKVSKIMPTQAEIEALEEDLAIKERSYRRALARMIAMAKLTLAANIADTGVVEQPGDGELVDPPLNRTLP